MQETVEIARRVTYSLHQLSLEAIMWVILVAIIFFVSCLLLPFSKLRVLLLVLLLVASVILLIAVYKCTS